MHGVFAYVLGVSGLLALVSFLPPLAARMRLPYTVLLAAVGLALGLLIQVMSAFKDLGPLGDFFASLRELDLPSDVLLAVFLPILLFETALAVPVRRLLDDLAPILLMAVVAVLVCTFAVGYALSAVTSMGLVACLLVGALLATTDPAAVIGIFRDLGAPRRLVMLAEGESLLNDAAAIAVFSLLLEMLTRKAAGGGPAAAVEGFVIAFIGGGLVGYAAGRIACFVVAPVRDQPAAEITLTVALAYLTYVVAEHYVNVSGVVAVVTAALVVGSIGRTRISPDTWGALEHVWRQLGFWASSLIFLLTAILVPRFLQQFGWGDALALGVLILAALGARALVLFGLLPMLSFAGLAERVSHAYKTVMLWGALRGALSLALALSVTENWRVPDRIQDFVAVMATGFVFFTLFVNGPTLRPLIRLLGLDRLSPVERAIRNRALALSLVGVRERVEEVAHCYEIDRDHPGGVIERFGERIAAIDCETDGVAALSEDDRIAIGLVILLTREEEIYLRHFREGLISRPVTEVLTSRTARALDAARERGRQGCQEAVEGMLAFSGWMRVASLLHRRFRIDGPLARRLSMRFEALMAARLALSELIGFNRQRVGPVLGPGAAQALDAMLTDRLDRIRAALEGMRLQYPDYADRLRQQYLGRAALRLEEAEYRTMHAESIISQEVLNDLERELETRRRGLERPPRLDLRLDLPTLVAAVPLFAGLPPERIKEIAWRLKARLVLPGEHVVRKGEKGDAMFFIASGAVEVHAPGLAEPVRLGTGDFFGEMALLTGARRNADVQALGYCQILTLHERDFRRLTRRHPDLKTHIEAVAEARRAAAAPPPAIPAPIPAPEPAPGTTP